MLEPGLHRFDWTTDRARNFLKLLQRHRPQMLIDDGNRVSHDLPGQGTTVSVQMQLLQMVAQLIEQAFAQVATGDARRIELAHNFQRLVQVGDGKVYGRNPGWRCRCPHCRRSGCRVSVVRRAWQLNLGCDLWFGIWPRIWLRVWLI